jgi:hypothetical protein
MEYLSFVALIAGALHNCVPVVDQKKFFTFLFSSLFDLCESKSCVKKFTNLQKKSKKLSRLKYITK